MYQKAISAIICILMVLQLIPSVAFADSSGGVDIVFAIDTGSAMQNYDMSGEGILQEALAGVIEQAPYGSKFGVVTKAGSSSLTDAQTATAALNSIPAYSGDSNPSALLQNAADLLSYSNKQKMVVLSTSLCDNTLIQQANALEAQGFWVYIIAFGQTNSSHLGYEHLFSCADVREVSFRIADLYKLVAEIAPYTGDGIEVLEFVAEPKFQSSFRIGNHDFGATASLTKGACLAALLNMYYLMPAQVIGEYEFGSTYNEKIGKGDSYGLLAGAQSTFLPFYETKAAEILGESQSLYVHKNYGVAADPNLRELIDENLKRRFPVFINYDDVGATYLITGFGLDDGVEYYEYFDFSSGTQTTETVAHVGTGAGKREVSVLDTQKYISAIYATLYFSAEFYNDKEEIKVNIPKGYANKDGIIRYMDGYSYAIDPNSVGDDYVIFDLYEGVKFTVIAPVGFDGLIPEYHNTTMNFCLNDDRDNVPEGESPFWYTDVPDNYWAFDYIFDMTNKEIIIGELEIDGDSVDDPKKRVFYPEKNVTVAAYLKMVILTADIEPVNGSWVPDADEHWAKHYIDYAKDLLPADLKNLSYLELDDDSNPISRELAFYIAWEIFTSKDCRTPTPLVEFDVASLNLNTVFSDLGNANDTYLPALAQLYKNSIVAGYADGTVNPTGNIKRSEICKVLSMCVEQKKLVKTDGTIDTSLFADFTSASPGNTHTAQTNDWGFYAYSFSPDVSGFYPITIAGNGVAATVYKADGAGADAAYTRLTPTEEGGSNYFVGKNENIIIAVSGRENQEFTVEVGEKLTALPAPKLEFHKNEGTTYLFVNNRESIRKENVVNISDAQAGGPRSWIASFKDLDPGRYVLYVGHLNETAYDRNSDAAVDYSDPEWPAMADSAFPIVVDARISRKNSQTNVRVARASYWSSSNPKNENQSWAGLQGWADYYQDNIFQMATGTETDASGTPVTVKSSDSREHKFNYKDINSTSPGNRIVFDASNTGYLKDSFAAGTLYQCNPSNAMFMVVEFYVDNGPVDIDIGAYNTDIPDVDERPVEGTVAPGVFVPDHQILGWAPFDTTIVSNLSYIINDNTTYLPVSVSNTSYQVDGNGNFVDQNGNITTQEEEKVEVVTQDNIISQFITGGAPRGDNYGLGPLYAENDMFEFDYTDFNQDGSAGETHTFGINNPWNLGNGVIGFNLGNWGIKYQYNIQIYNEGSDREFVYNMETFGNYFAKLKSTSGDYLPKDDFTMVAKADSMLTVDGRTDYIKTQSDIARCALPAGELTKITLEVTVPFAPGSLQNMFKITTPQ